MADDLFETTVEVTVTREFSRSFKRSSVPGQAFLVVIAGPRLGHRVLLSQETLEIGRGASCNFQLDADSVSRLHARIQWEGHHRVIDLRSTNGTFVNELRITEHTLVDGDRIGIGKVLLKYLSGENVEAAYHEEIQRLMRYDGLTGVFNRSHFDETIHNVIWRSRFDPQPTTLVVFDLDHFKRINDTLGHPAGDAVLRQCASVVSQTVPQGCLLARTGGEEFAVLCPGLTYAQGHHIAEHVRRAVESSAFVWEGTRVPVTVSLGVAEKQPTDTSHETLYERADAQLYAAKAAGRNCVR